MISKKVNLIEFENNPNIGLYMFVNDKFCLIGIEVSDELKKNIEKVLNVPIYNITMLNTPLIGVFLSGNNKILIVPEIISEELSKLEVIAKKHDIKVLKINEKLNTFGNNLSVGDEEILISKEYNKEFIPKLKKLTNMNIIKVGTKEYTSTGGLCRFIDGKYFISQELNENDFNKIITKIAGVGTINSGSNFISSGVVGNKNGILIGSNSSTIEIQNIVESFNN